MAHVRVAAGAGDGGGRVVAEGSPEQVARVKGSYTGKFLKRVLERA
jgi:excinuclease ABC subunit A